MNDDERERLGHWIEEYLERLADGTGSLASMAANPNKDGAPLEMLARVRNAMAALETPATPEQREDARAFAREWDAAIKADGERMRAAADRKT